MRVLFVTPSEVSSGEAVTALHIARELAASGDEVGFLASPFTSSLLRESLGPSVQELGDDLGENQRIWDRAVRALEPVVVVFADYPLLFLPNGVAPLADDGWVSRLERSSVAGRARLVTLDHLGYAQRPATVFFGPPHLSFLSATFPPLPTGMEVLLPCPSHEPADVSGRRGLPFCAWESPPTGGGRSSGEVRRRYGVGEGGLLVVHATPQWAWRMAEQFGLPYYHFLPRILEHYLCDLDRPVTIVSVNNGRLLPAAKGGRVRVVNLGPVPVVEFEDLLLAGDLVISENAVSVTMGKAACAGVPCALLRNSFRLSELLEQADPPLRRVVQQMEAVRLGSVFPYEVFPVWRRDELLVAGVAGCARLELFGGEPTRRLLHGLLRDDEARSALRSQQRAYAERLARLPSPGGALRAIAGLQRA